MIYKSKNFSIDGLNVNKIARKYKTPIYCYSFKKLKENIINFNKNFKNINPLTCFSVKANSNKILLNEIGKLGLGADVVSIGELLKALKSGIGQRPRKQRSLGLPTGPSNPLCRRMDQENRSGQLSGRASRRPLFHELFLTSESHHHLPRWC